MLGVYVQIEKAQGGMWNRSDSLQSNNTYAAWSAGFELSGTDF